MFIAPNSTIRLLRGVKLDPTYKNTIHFNSSAEQSSYFAAKAKYTLNEYTYVRKERAIRVGVLSDNLYDCSYLMFQNSAFGNKWFYAFITNVEYLNNETSQITYEIDVMQTWYFDYTVWPSFVEREHVTGDTPGDNLVPDNFELGEYVCDDFEATGHLGFYKIVVAATFDENYDDVAGGNYSNIYSGLHYNVFDSYEDANDFIEGAGAKVDGIVSVFMMPRDFAGDVGDSPKNYNIEIAKKITGAIDGYTPKNNKLYTYPYNFLYVTNLNGVSAVFPYEYFSTPECNFGLTGDMSCNPQVILEPKNYKGIPANYNEKMALDGFPQCAFSIDVFKAWLAQTGATLGIQAGTAIGTAAAGYAIADPNMMISGMSGIMNTLATVYQHAIMPDQARGTQGNSAMTAMRIKDFAFIHMHIQAEFAEIIDEFWDVYGYPVHRVKRPNISTRPHWNYVKTREVSITGNVPGDDLAKIKSIYDAGVTFWRNGDEVGNYGLDNSI